MGGQQGLDALAVFAWMHGAGGVHQPATGSQQRQQRLQQPRLQHHQLLDGGGLHPPARIGVAGQGAEAGAGGIEQHPIEGAAPLGMRICKLGGIGGLAADRREPEPGGIGLEPLQAGGGAVDRPHLAAIGHGLGDLGALAAGGGAGIQHPLARLRIEQRHDALGGPVLHAPAALAVARQAAQIPRPIAQHQAAGAIAEGFGGDAGGGQIGLQGLAAAAQRVHAQIQAGRAVAGAGEGLGRVGRQPAHQLAGQPARQRMAQTQRLSGVAGQGQAEPGGAQAGPGRHGIAAPQHGPQQAVHHRRQASQAALLGEIHRGVHRGRRRHPLTEQQLIEPHMQQPAQGGGLALGRHPAVGIDPGIQQPSLTHRAVEQLGGQGPVGARQGVARQFPLQGRIGIGAGGHRLQGAPDQAPRVQAKSGAAGQRGLRGERSHRAGHLLHMYWSRGPAPAARGNGPAAGSPQHRQESLQPAADRAGSSRCPRGRGSC